LIMSFAPKRRNGLELIDLPPETYNKAEFAGSLADIRKVNRFLGDIRAVRKHFSVRVAGIEASPVRPVKVLDIATGSADIPAAIVQWARRYGINTVVTAVDLNPLAVGEAAALARKYPEITVSLADGLSLPFEDGSFDIVICIKTLHHFSQDDTIRLLKEVNRVTSRGYIIMDLRRSWVAWGLISMITKFFTRNRLTKYDGPMSVLRSYTVPELNALVESAGLTGQVVKEPFWLMVVTGRKSNNE
jgi:ubiquinone/menaquinone biosynthesis C-methylase UbiE